MITASIAKAHAYKFFDDLLKDQHMFSDVIKERSEKGCEYADFTLYLKFVDCDLVVERFNCTPEQLASALTYYGYTILESTHDVEDSILYLKVGWI